MGTWYRRQVHGIGLEPWPELHPLRRLLAGIPSSYVLDCGVRACAGRCESSRRAWCARVCPVPPVPVLFCACRFEFARHSHAARLVPDLRSLLGFSSASWSQWAWVLRASVLLPAGRLSRQRSQAAQARLCQLWKMH